MKTLLLILLSAISGITQTSTSTYGNGCGSHCTYYYYASNRNSANDPVAVYFPGAGFGTPSKTCPLAAGSSQCIFFTDITNHNYQLYEVIYTGDGNGSAPFWPAAAANDFPCFFSEAIRLGLPGNWNNAIILCDSAGCPGSGITTMATVGKYLAACNSNNTTWTIQGWFDNSGPADMTNGTNGFNLSQPTVTSNLFNGNPASGGTPATLAADATVTNYVSQWIAKGAPRIIQVTGTSDATVLAVNQELLPAAIATAGYSSNISQQLITGYGHTVDDPITFTGSDAWPSTLLNDTVHQTTPWCNNSPNSSPNAAYSLTLTASSTMGSDSITVNSIAGVGFEDSIYAPSMFPDPTFVNTFSGSTITAFTNTSAVKINQNALATLSNVSIKVKGLNPTCAMLGYTVRAWQGFLPGPSAASGVSAASNTW